MGKTNKKLKSSLKKYDKSKQNTETLISGELGITLNGHKIVEVPNRKGFVYVRLKGNTSELIQAFNATVAVVYDLPVFVVRQAGIYKVVGRNIDRYQNQFGVAPYLPKHGAQHSFNHDIGVGGDIAWIYSQQFMPLLSYPSGTYGSMTLSVQPHFYEWNGQWKYSQNTGTPSYTPYIPTITGSARMVLSYIDPSDNSIKLVPGTPFANSITGSAEIAQYIPDIPREVGIPLAAVRLVTGTTVLDWNSIYDMRDFYTVGKPSGSVGGGGGGGMTGLVGWDEGIYVATGTILNVTGPNATLSASGTVLNLNFTNPTFPSPQIGVVGWDEGVYVGTGTVLNVTGPNAALSISGTVLNLDFSNPTFPSPQIGVVGWDEGIFIGTGTVLNVTGPNAVLSLSGTVLNLNLSNPAFPSPQMGIVAWDDGVYVGTGTIVNFANNFAVSISGTVINVERGGHTILNDGTPMTARSRLSFAGNGITVSDDSGNDWTLVNFARHTIQNEGSALTSRASLNFIGASVTAADDSGNSRTNVTITARELLTADRTYYVRTDGSDSNTGLTNTAGGAFLTIQKALDVVETTIDIGGYDVTIQVGDGTYTGAVVIRTMTGGGTLTIQGNNSTPSNVLISTTSASGITVSGTLTTLTYVKDLKITTTTSGSSIYHNGNGTLECSGLVFGACAYIQIHTVKSTAVIKLTGTNTVNGSSVICMAVETGSIYTDGSTLTFSGTPAWSYAGLLATRLGVIAIYSTTISGSATGTRYVVEANAVIHTAGGGANYFPGNAAGSSSTGGQYI